MWRYPSTASFLEGLWPFRPRKFEAITALADRPGKSLKFHRDGDRSLQLLVLNEEFLVSASHQLALTTCARSHSAEGTSAWASRIASPPTTPPQWGCVSFGAETGLPCPWCGWPKKESPLTDARLVVVVKAFVSSRADAREALSNDPNVSSCNDASTATPADGGRRCVPVGCGTARAGPPIDSGRGPVRIGAAAKARAVDMPVEMPSRRSWLAARAVTACLGTCVLPAPACGHPIRPVLKHGPRSLTCVGRRGCFVEPCHGIESSKWAIFGKQNWRCGMNRKPGYGAKLRANLEPTKGVGRLRQQDGGHGSRNPLRRGRGGRCKTLGVSPGGAAVGADLGGSSKYSNENFEGRRGERFHVNGTCTWPAHPGIDSVGGKGSRQNGSVTSGKGLALRAGHGGPSPEPVGCRRTARAASAARAGRRVPAGGRIGNGLFGGLPRRRTANSELSESGLEATRVPAACLPTSSRGLGPQRHVSLAKLVRRTSRAGRLEVGSLLILVRSTLVAQAQLATIRAYDMVMRVCDALRCSGPHARYTDVFNEYIALADRPGKSLKFHRDGDRSLQLLVLNEEFLVSASHQLALTTCARSHSAEGTSAWASRIASPPTTPPQWGCVSFGAETGLPCPWCGWPKKESPLTDARLVVVVKAFVSSRADAREALSNDPNVSSCNDASTATPADGGRRCVPVGCGTARAGPPIDSGRGPVRIGAAAKARAVDMPVEMPSRRSWLAARAVTACLGTCVLPAPACGHPIRPVLKHGPRSLTCVGRRGCFVEPCHGIESSKWAIFGKQNWRCGMNRKPGYGAKLRANLEPTKGVGRLRQQDGGHGSRNPLRSV
ncbi:hypothetical protein L6452_46567 [Arctium lappa]|nr:hypothetical protein L6452_46567 [Arctium lappa]